MYGFAGKILYVNLTTKKIRSKPLDDNLVEKYIGGLGINLWLTYNLIGARVDPLSPNNVIVFGVGPLVGTLAPGASRVYVSSRSPDSGLICCANAGHSAGLMMKFAGYDNLVITGKAKTPVYLRISDEEVEICDASHLWGKDAWQTTDLLQKDLHDYWVDCIGPSAENLVRYSIILCSKRSSFNKTGPGTVLASKNLKAIVAKGTKGVRVAYPDRFKELIDKITRKIILDRDLKIYRTYGGSIRDRPGYTSEDLVSRIIERPYACFSCPVACKHIVNLRDGAYKGLSYRISNLVALAAHNRLGGPENWDELVKVVEMENRYGIEASVIAGMLNYLKECYEHDLIPEDIMFIPKISGKTLLKLITITAKRKGIGKLTAEGFYRIINKMGEETEKYAKHHKGIGREHGLEREISLSTIGSLTNPRGGKAEFSHFPYGNSNSIGLSQDIVKLFCTDLKLGFDDVEHICGSKGFNVSRLLKWVEDYSVAYMCMGFCYRPPLMNQINLETLSQLYEATTGLRVSPKNLLSAGERVFNIIKAFNIKMGATRRDDLPSRGATWPGDESILISGENYGTLNQILDQYYDERGWNIETGVPTREKLTSLGLGSIENALEA